MNLAKLLLVLIPLIAPIANLQAGNEDLFSLVETSRSKPSPIAYAVEIARPDVVKFLIDRNEDVNKSTPAIPVYYDSGDWHPIVRRVADEPGKTPLDLAIEKHNAEIVQILLQYHPTKNANVEYEVVRYQPEHLFTRYLDGFETSTSIPQKRSSPLIDAINGANSQIVSLIIKAYRSQDKLSEAFPLIKQQNNKDFMRSWIQQTVKLWKNEEITVPDAVLDLFLTKTVDDAISERDYGTLSLLIEHGMLINKDEFQAAISTKDYDLIALLFNKGRMNPNFEPADMLLNNHLEHLIDPNNLINFTASLARLDRLYLLELVIDQMDEKARSEASLIAARHGSINTLQFLASLGIPMDEAFLESITSNQNEAFALLLEQPLKESTLNDAITMAYDLHRYDMLTILLQKGVP